MLSVYVPKGTTLERVNVESGATIPENAVWIDMVTPSVQEDRAVEQLMGIAIPTREEMQEIEVEPTLCGEWRAIHDGHAHVPVGHGHSEDHCGNVYYLGSSSCNRAL